MEGCVKYGDLWHAGKQLAAQLKPEQIDWVMQWCQGGQRRQALLLFVINDGAGMKQFTAMHNPVADALQILQH